MSYKHGWQAGTPFLSEGDQPRHSLHSMFRKGVEPLVCTQIDECELFRSGVEKELTIKRLVLGDRTEVPRIEEM